MSFGLRIDPQALWTRQNITLALMLLGLHFALMLDLGSGASRAGAFRPKCRYALLVATRPRAVRIIKPCWIR